MWWQIPPFCRTNLFLKDAGFDILFHSFNLHFHAAFIESNIPIITPIQSALK